MFEIAFWKIAAGLGVPGFALGIVAFLFKPLGKLFQSYGPRIVLPAIMAYMVIVGGIMIVAIVRLTPTGDYIFRVTVYDPEGKPVEGAQLVSDLGGEPKGEFRDGQEYAISRAQAGDNAGVTFTATFRGMAGHASAKFGRGTVPVRVNLMAGGDGKLKVNVVGEDGKGIARVRVIVESSGAAGETNDDGFVAVAVGALPGAEVSIRVEKSGYTPVRRSPFAGSAPVTIEMKRDAP